MLKDRPNGSTNRDWTEAAARRPEGDGGGAPVPARHAAQRRGAPPRARARAHPAARRGEARAPARPAAGGDQPGDRASSSWSASSRWAGRPSSRTRWARCCRRATPGPILPGEVKADGPVLPQWAYTAAAWGERGAGGLGPPHRPADALESGALLDAGAEVAGRRRTRRASRSSRVLKQLQTCALVYRCFTSQNIFYVRDEGAIPASVMCNAHCVGCISDQPEDGPPASHERMDDGPSARGDGRASGSHHLQHADGPHDGQLRPGLRGRAAHAVEVHRRGDPLHARAHRSRLDQHQHQRQPARRGSRRSSTRGSTRSASRSTRR